ncbi:MAG TPA: DUF2065 domain-containing protein [Rhodospirillales bacterium]|jgi:uncharacterized protein YjeT (DUF2065 family)|nr:DUF2065 domain-containing protein [Rhodospirillales bacterium]
MDDPINVLWAALGLAIAIEGIVYALFPEAMKRMMAMVMVQPTGSIRGAGIGAAVAGVIILWLVQG